MAASTVRVQSWYSIWIMIMIFSYNLPFCGNVEFDLKCMLVTDIFICLQCVKDSTI